MIALKIIVNGKYCATAGQEDWSVLASHVSATRPPPDKDGEETIRFSVGGLSQFNEEGIAHHFRWKEINLEPGDKVEVEVTETAEVDPPVKRYRSDSEVQEDPFTEEEMREMRYQDYLELRKEFENT
ncbi:MAG: hypothetical protein LPH21_13565 [Shewanella sp.]|nr:hypothetical protein [Shewanella sp.]